MAPVVHVLADASGAPPQRPVRRDTSRAPYAVREMLSEEMAGVRFRMQQIWGEEAAP
jgi:hypothetical protein